MTASYFLRTLPFSQFRYVEPGPDPTDNIALKWDGLGPLDPGGHIFPLHRYLWFPIWAGWLITILFSALWITRWIKRRRFPAIPYLIDCRSGHRRFLLHHHLGSRRLGTPDDLP